jgi:hypothetical protein
MRQQTAVHPSGNAIPHPFSATCSPEDFALLARRVCFPATGEIRSESQRPGEIPLLAEKPAHHRGELSELDVLESHFAREPGGFVLSGLWHELPVSGAAIDVPLLLFHVPAQVAVEVFDRLQRAAGVSGARRRDEPAESLIEGPVLGDPTLELRFL